MPGAMLPNLTVGSIDRILKGEDVRDPILQICQMKRVVPDNGQVVRLKLCLTDGPTKALAMASTQLNDRFMTEGGNTDTNSIIKLTNYKFQEIANRKLIVLIEFDLLATGVSVGRSLETVPEASTGASTNVHQSGHASNGTGQQRPRAAAGQSAGQRLTTAVTMQNSNIHPIDSLTPYQNKWCIRARVTNKRDIKTYSNSRGEGKLFSVDVADNSGEIRCTGFNAECDKFFPLMTVGQVFFIRNGQIKTANRQYSSVNNDYELTFNAETQVEPCYDDTAFKLPEQKFNFVPFNQIENKPKEGLIDIIGVVESVAQCEKITSRTTQKEFEKRNIRLIDDSKCSINLTLWGQDAEKFECTQENPHPILAVKGVKISDFQGLSLSASFGAQLVFNPDRSEAWKLRGWYDNNGSKETFQNLTSASTGGSGGAGPITLLALAEAERLGMGDKPDFFTVKGTISAIKTTNCLYKACPTTECNKKLTELDNLYRCEKCSKEFTTFKWRMMLSAQIYDFSGQIWVTFFQESAEKLLGVTTDELGNLREMDEDKYNNVFTKSHFKTFMMKLKAKMETYNDETRVKHTCVNVSDLNFAEYERHLDADVKKMESIPSIY